MGRSKMESELVRSKYPLFTETLRRIASQSDMQNKGSPDIDRLMAEAVWSEGGLRFRREFLKSNNLSNDFDSARREPPSLIIDALVQFIMQVFEYEDSLSELDDEQIIENYRAHRRLIDDASSAKRVRKGATNDRFAFFNDLKAEANWKKWLAKPAWTSEEAAALSLGKDPNVVNILTLNDLRSLHGSPFRDTFFERLDDIDRAIKAKMLSDAIKPSNFVKWAQTQNFEMPELLQAELNMKNSASGTISRNHLHKCYNIILGLATKHYGLASDERHKAQSLAIGKMHSDLQSVAAGIDIRTLKNILSNAEIWAHASEAPLVTKAQLDRAKADAKAKREKLQQAKNGISRP